MVLGRDRPCVRSVAACCPDRLLLGGWPTGAAGGLILRGSCNSVRISPIRHRRAVPPSGIRRHGGRCASARDLDVALAALRMLVAAGCSRTSTCDRPRTCRETIEARDLAVGVCLDDAGLELSLVSAVGDRHRHKSQTGSAAGGIAVLDILSRLDQPAVPVATTSGSDGHSQCRTSTRDLVGRVPR